MSPFLIKQIHTNPSFRGFKIKINVITKHTFALVKFLRIVNKDMRR